MERVLKNGHNYKLWLKMSHGMRKKKSLQLIRGIYLQEKESQENLRMLFVLLVIFQLQMSQLSLALINSREEFCTLIILGMPMNSKVKMFL